MLISPGTEHVTKTVWFPTGVTTLLHLCDGHLELDPVDGLIIGTIDGSRVLIRLSNQLIDIG